MKPGLAKLTGAIAGALLLAGVVLPTAVSAAAPTTQKVIETECGTNGAVPGTVITSTLRGVTTTRTTYSGEITTTVIVPVGTPPVRARFMASDEAGNEYFATTKAKALAAATAFNRANPGRAVGNGVIYYGHTPSLAQAAAANADTMGYGNGVPVSSTPEFLATSANGTAFWSNCSQARANYLARRDTNRPPKKVWHATNATTGQRVTSAVSERAANDMAAYHYVAYTPGEVAAYGFNCQILTAASYMGLITDLQAQIAALPYVSYGGDFLGYDTTGTNPADMQMFRGATQSQANALAYAFGKSIVKGGVFVVDAKGTCVSVGPNMRELIAQQGIEQLTFFISPTGMTIGPSVTQSATVSGPTGLKEAYGGDLNVGGTLVVLGIDVAPSSTTSTYPLPMNGTFNASWNMAYYDSGRVAADNPAQPSQELTTPFMATHATLPTQTITCTPESSALPGATSVTLLSYACPPNYQESTP
jgi:hypothetical protein